MTQMQIADQLIPSLNVMFEIKRGFVPRSHRIETHPQAGHVGLEARGDSWMADGCSHA